MNEAIKDIDRTITVIFIAAFLIITFLLIIATSQCSRNSDKADRWEQNFANSTDSLGGIIEYSRKEWRKDVKKSESLKKELDSLKLVPAQIQRIVEWKTIYRTDTIFDTLKVLIENGKTYFTNEYRDECLSMYCRIDCEKGTIKYDPIQFSSDFKIYKVYERGKFLFFGWNKWKKTKIITTSNCGVVKELKLTEIKKNPDK